MKQVKLNRLEALDRVGAESLNAICSNLSFASENFKKIMLTSASAREGKSYLSVHILNNLARRGKRVALVDCDLRKSDLVNQYGVEGVGKGLAEYLTDGGLAEDVVYETNVPGAYLVPAGAAVVDPLPLLHSPKFTALLEELTAKFDLVLIDTPSVGLVIDAAEIAALCDGAVLVCEYGKTRRKDLAQAKRQIEAAHCPIIGCVMNKVSFKTISSKMYYNKALYARMKSGYYDQRK